jgi:hypothetical protein
VRGRKERKKTEMMEKIRKERLGDTKERKEEKERVLRRKRFKPISQGQIQLHGSSPDACTERFKRRRKKKIKKYPERCRS